MSGSGRRGQAWRERGSATVMWAAALTLASGIAVTSAVLLLLQIHAHRVQGAADLVALAAAGARYGGTGTACEVAQRAAASARVELVACDAAGDLVDFVVTVRVAASAGVSVFGSPTRAEAEAHAGVRTG